MGPIYEAIGRLVVAFVSRRYRQELQTAGLAVLVLAALIAVLLGLRQGADARSGALDRGLERVGARRKRGFGSFVSIR